MQPFFASEYFVPRLSEFAAKHPQIDIQVGTSDESAEKHPSDADLSIRLFRSPPANMPSNRVFSRCECCLRVTGVQASAEGQKKKIVSDFPLIVHETHPKAWSQWAAAAGIQLPKENKSHSPGFDDRSGASRAARHRCGPGAVPIGELWFKRAVSCRLFKQRIRRGQSATTWSAPKTAPMMQASPSATVDTGELRRIRVNFSQPRPEFFSFEVPGHDPYCAFVDPVSRARQI